MECTSLHVFFSQTISVKKVLLVTEYPVNRSENLQLFANMLTQKKILRKSTDIFIVDSEKTAISYFEVDVKIAPEDMSFKYVDQIYSESKQKNLVYEFKDGIFGNRLGIFPRQFEIYARTLNSTNFGVCLKKSFELVELLKSGKKSLFVIVNDEKDSPFYPTFNGLKKISEKLTI